ncbi:MAG: hypothetical protein NW226_04725 [Microscillaceae bacterium]|nr:hypothetical protein [Microscillaceae bacterium]
MKNFENWETQDVEMTFGIVQEKKSTLLEDWLHAKTEITDQERQTLEGWREKLLYHADFWNEDELKLQFIAPLLDFVDYTLTYCKPFSQRKLTAKIQDIHVGGWVDYMLASGKQKPIRPFFFLHEYKQERKGDADPKGQLLIEMLTAQHLNDYLFPIYGCYVVGRNWFFMVLEANQYAVSDAFVATQEDIYQIIAIMRKVKVYIAEIVQKIEASKK